MAEITIEVRAFADFRGILGARTEIVLAQGQTMRDLLEILSERHSGLREKIFDPEGQIGEGAEILLNGRVVDRAGGLATELRHGDQAFFFPPLSGG